MTRVLAGAADNAAVVLYDGEVLSDSATPVTVRVTDDAGAEVLPASTVATHDETGVYSVALTPVMTARLDALHFEWAVTLRGAGQVLRTDVEIVGGFYTHLARLRTLPDLHDPIKHPAARLASVRNWAETTIERFLGVAYVPRYRRDVLDGNGHPAVPLTQLYPREIRRGWIDGTTADVADWGLHPSGYVVRIGGGTFPRGVGNVRVDYTHGHDGPPYDLIQACETLIRWRMLEDRSALPDRRLAVTNEFGNVALATAGPNRPTGIPDVDAVLLAYREHRLVLA